MSLAIEVDSQKIGEFRQRWKTAEFQFFGSVLRADFGPDSDVDVLVDFEPGAKIGLFELVDMERELETMFGRKVDVVTRGSVRNPFRRHYMLERPEHVMTPQDRDAAYLWDMLRDAKEILELAGQASEERRHADEKLSRAVQWFVGRLGRAAARVSGPLRGANPAIPWVEAAELADRVLHESGLTHLVPL